MDKFTIGDEVKVMRRKCNTPIGKKLAGKTGFVQMITIQKYRDGSTETIICIEFPEKFRIVPLIQQELKIIKYKYMNPNTPRPTTVKQDITKFLSENTDVVNPLIMAKAVRRKLSSVRRELRNMINEGIVEATYDARGFYTSIKLAPANENGVPFPKDVPTQIILKDDVTKRTDFDQPTEEERNVVLSQLEDMKIPYEEVNPLKDAEEQNESAGKEFYNSPSELVLNEATPAEKDSFWSKIMRIFK